MVTAAGLRLLYLAQSSLEHLEATYLFEAVKPATLWGVVTGRQAAEQMHQPAFDLILRGVAEAFGTSEAALRAPSVVFSVECVPLTWALARREGGAWGALVAAALVGFAPLLVWYGRDASPYALLALASLTAVVSAYEAMETGARRPAIRAGIALARAVYVPFHGAWVALTVGAWMLLRRDRRAVLRTTVLTATLLILPATAMVLAKLWTSVVGLHEDQPVMRYSHDPLEATTEALRLLVAGPGWALWGGLALVVYGVWRQRRSPLGRLALVAVGLGLLAEAHILWQLHRSKGILYVDVRHYVYLVPLLGVSVAAARPRWVGMAALGLQLWTAIPLVTQLEKPDVRGAVSYIRPYLQPNHAVAFLPAPWYEPIVETYLLGICPELVHARSYDAWWSLDGCRQTEQPAAGSVYGFPFLPERMHALARRRQLDYLWVIDIRDHRFGLPVPPSEPQERFLCWEGARAAVLMERAFGPWVRLWLLDTKKLAQSAPPPPPAPPGPASSVTGAGAWERPCRPSAGERVP